MGFAYEFVVVFVLTLFLSIFFYYKWAFRYWKKQNVPGFEPSIPFGNVIRNVNIGIQSKNAYDEAKNADWKHLGFYMNEAPGYMPVDLKIIQCVLQQDFQYFTERGFYYNERDDPLSANLFALGGEKWRFIRTKLSPAFTSGKLKLMLDPLTACACQMAKFVDDLCKNKKTLDVKEVMACFTTDVIGSCAFGLQCNSFTHPDTEFRQRGKQIFDFTSIIRLISTGVAFVYPNFSRWLGIRLFDKETADFFINIVRNAVKYRKKNKVIRKDILQLLMELEKDLKVDNEAALKELTAQVFIFFAAGFETSSITLCFCFYELAQNLQIQKKLREEITKILAKHQGNITYEAIMEMKYLNQVVDETLRKYPPVSFLTRVCVNNYKIPGTDCTLEKDIQVLIPVFGLHRDPEYYPEPETFNPERFSDENKKKRPPFTYIPFGEGPRICIGLRFGLMQVKVGIITLLSKYKFSLNGRMATPLEIEPYSFTLIPKQSIYLDVKSIDKLR